MVRPLSLASKEPSAHCVLTWTISLSSSFTLSQKLCLSIPQAHTCFRASALAVVFLGSSCTGSLLCYLCLIIQLSLSGTSLGRTSSLSMTTLSQPPCHSTMLEFLQSWESTSSLSMSLLSLKCKVTGTVLSMG